VSRHASRERALQTLFQMDVNDMDSESAIAAAQTLLEEAAYDVALYRQLVGGVLAHRQWLDESLVRFSEDWEVERMSGVDRNILRIALYELAWQPDLPHAIVMDEAVELCKEYATEHSARFVNGVLAGVVRDIERLRQEATNQSP